MLVSVHKMISNIKNKNIKKINISLGAVLIALTTTTGIIIHDAHLDSVASLIMLPPVAIASYGVLDNLSSKTEHTHVERVSFDKTNISASNSKQPKTRIRDDVKKYLNSKKTAYTSGDAGVSLWPSV